MKIVRLCFALAILFSATAARAQMSAHYINVGQADSILLEFTHAAVLIDAGGETTDEATGGKFRDRDHLIDYLNKFFARRTDLNRTLAMIVISHPHIDHTKNLGAVMQAFRVQRLLDGGNQSGSGIAPLRAARTAAGNRYRAITDQQIVTSSGKNGWEPIPALMTNSNVDLRVIAASRGCENGNNDSLIVLVKYRAASYLFSGDAETDEDGACLGEVPVTVDFYNGTNRLDVDVYKVGHHGSRNGTDEAFLQAMTPKIAVISAGIHTQHGPGVFHAFQFGHPRENIVDILEEALSTNRDPKNFYTMEGSKRLKSPRRIRKALYCTCWDGDVLVATNANGTQYNVTTSGR
jgi:competence protein ComEC